MNESSDPAGRAADPYRDGYEPRVAPGPRPHRAADPASTGLLDFPPMPPYPGYTPDAPEEAEAAPAPEAPPAAEPTGLSLATEATATARLRIKLPDSGPQPSTSLRPHAPWQDTGQDEAAPHSPREPHAAPFAQAVASPARPTALPSELAALATATMVVPLPPDARPTSALLTRTLPPDKAAKDNAARLAGAFQDTLEQIFGFDPDTAPPAAAHPARPGDRAAAGYPSPDRWRDEALADAPAEPAGFDAFGGPDQAPYAYVPGGVPAAAFGGAYGVPTQPAAFRGFAGRDPASREPGHHAATLRYLGGIFHDSSGESSYLDPDSVAAHAPHAGLAAPDAPTEPVPRIPAREPHRPPPRQASPLLARAKHRAAPLLARADRTGARGGPAEPKAGRRPPVVAGLCVAAAVILYGIALIFAGGVFGGTVPRGTSVQGVPIGGLSPADAQRAVETGLGAQADAPIPFVVGQTRMTLEPARSGLSIDAARTVAAAEAGRTDPFTVIPALFGADNDIAAVTSVDRPALRKSLTALAARFGTPMVEGRITFHAAVPVVTAPKEGRGFSIDAAAAAISSGYLRVSDPIVLPVEAFRPRVSPAALQAALAQIARPAVAAPLALVTGDVTTQLGPAQIGDALTIAPDAAGRLVPAVDGTRLHADLPASVLDLEQPAVNAAFTVPGGRPVLVPGRPGRGFSAAALSQAVLGVLTRPAPRSANVPIGDLPPAFSTRDAQALGVTDVLATSTLPVPYQPYRRQNTQRAADLVNGSVVQPGQTWSFLGAVGALTSANGFAVPGDAQRAGVDPSGGIDTVATGVFDAAFAAGMGDAIHHPHASYTDRYPVGLDAAVVEPSTDLQWTDDNTTPVYLYAAYANGTLTVALLGERRYDQVEVAVSARYAVNQPPATRAGCPAPGFQVDVTRTLIRGGGQVGSERYHVGYAPGGAGPCSVSSAPGPSGARSGTPGEPGGGGDGSGPVSTPASSPPTPAPSSSGLLGGLLGH